MSVQLSLNIRQNARDLLICQDYWSFDNNGSYIEHIKAVCHRYDINPYYLCDTVGKCFAYLDDVLCEHCGYICALEVPADIPYMRAKVSWSCEVCEYTLWREHNNR